MFFIVPENPPPRSPQHVKTSQPNKRRRNPVEEDDDQVAGYYPRRNPRACNRCKMKKARCSGGVSCAKCRKDGVVCVTTQPDKADEKPKSPAYVKMVEAQRDVLLRALYKVWQDNGASAEAFKDINHTLEELGISSDSLTGAPSEPHLNPAIASNTTSVSEPASVLVKAEPGQPIPFKNLHEAPLQSPTAINLPTGSQEPWQPEPIVDAMVDFQLPEFDPSTATPWREADSDLFSWLDPEALDAFFQSKTYASNDSKMLV